MKKFFTVFCALVLMVPASIVAAPNDQEVCDTLIGVSSVFTYSSLQAMMGAVNAKQLTIKKDEKKNITTFIYTNYPTKELNGIAKVQGRKVLIPFTHMSGKVIVTGNMMTMQEKMDMVYDVRLKGCGVKTLYHSMKIDETKNGKDELILKVNGRKYSQAETKRIYEKIQNDPRYTGEE